IFVKVNFNMVDYLPASAQSTKAVKIMDTEFTEPVPNADVMVKNVSIPEAKNYKEKILNVKGVSEVLWLDNVMDIKKPIETVDKVKVVEYYKNGNAYYAVAIADGFEEQALKDIRRVIGNENYLSGEASDLVTAQNTTSSEVKNAMLILLPAIIIILLLATSSWLEPLLFLITIGAAIVINLGTNIFLGQVSFLSNSVSPILQMAVSLDYAVFLLHSFAHFRKKHEDPNTAMKHAIRASFFTVAASALTTFCGFLALTFMEFGIGADLGLNLAKGIILSFLSAMILLPALTLSLYKIVDKTMHRPFLPSFANINKIFSKISIPAMIIVALLIVPAFLGQAKTEFKYGSQSAAVNSRSGYDARQIVKEFGNRAIAAILVPKGDFSKEEALSDELEKLPHVSSVISYANSVGKNIPVDFVGKDLTDQFYSENYSRIVVYTDTEDEGAVAFNTVEEIQSLSKKYYGNKAYTAGQSANLYDMKNVVADDNFNVTLMAVIAIFLVLLLNFRSLLLPFILLITIEAGIWINLSLPYFFDQPINFIGYLIINTVQLGATVDYAILLTDHYLKNRQRLPQKEAMDDAMGKSFKSILVSGATLSIAGFILYITSTNPSISDLGMLLCRGTIFSIVMVTCFLPGMLRLFDKAIGRFTYKSNFLRVKK
ncbi:MAG: efflux RND transporter permease subunit, partial [Anaerovoracaceae bacterium]